MVHLRNVDQPAGRSLWEAKKGAAHPPLDDVLGVKNGAYVGRFGRRLASVDLGDYWAAKDSIFADLHLFLVFVP